MAPYAVTRRNDNRGGFIHKGLKAGIHVARQYGPLIRKGTGMALKYIDKKRKSQTRRKITTRRRGGGGVIAENGHSTTFSRSSRTFKTDKKYLKGFKKVIAVQKLRTVGETMARSPRNFQTAFLLNAFTGSTGTQSPYILNNVDTGAMLSLLQLTDPLSTATIGGDTRVNQTNLARQRKYSIGRTSVMYRIKNQHNLAIKVRLYDVVARRDCDVPRDPVSDWEVGMDREIMYPAGTINAVSSAYDYKMPGATPFESTLFCQNWKVIKTTKVVIHAGSEHHHTLSVKPGGLFNAARTEVYSQYKGLTTTCMMVVEGGLGFAGPIGTGDLPPFRAAISAADIVCLSEYRTSFQCFERSKPTQTLHFGLQLGPFTDANTVESINDEQDTPTIALNANAAT